MTFAINFIVYVQKEEGVEMNCKVQSYTYSATLIRPEVSQKYRSFSILPRALLNLFHRFYI